MSLTVGKLKEILKDLPDDIPVVQESVNCEMRGAITQKSKYSIAIRKYRKERASFRDGFDGTRYTSEIYVMDEEGEKMLHM